MLGIKIICVGKMKEAFFINAVKEYEKRLSGCCKLEIEEVREQPLSANPGKAEIDSALEKEVELISGLIPKTAVTIALCIEGKAYDSIGFSSLLQAAMSGGSSRLCFIIGGSFGLHRKIKEFSTDKLSMSPMTFPHHLARVMLLEQIYRAFKILEGSKYHK